jgi:hypothetical protein
MPFYLCKWIWDFRCDSTNKRTRRIYDAVSAISLIIAFFIDLAILILYVAYLFVSWFLRGLYDMLKTIFMPIILQLIKPLQIVIGMLLVVFTTILIYDKWDDINDLVETLGDFLF